MIKLLDGTDSTGSGVKVRDGHLLAAWGTWDTATVTLEFSPDGGTTWIALNDVQATAISFTDDGYARVKLFDEGVPMYNRSDIELRGAVSGAGTSTSVSLALLGTHE